MSRQGPKVRALTPGRLAAGCGVSLGCYLALQPLLAALLSGEVLPPALLPAVMGPVAALSVAVGTLLAGRGQGSGRALLSGAVAAGFLLTLLVVSLAAGGTPWSADAGTPVLLGSMAAAALTAPVGGGKRKRTARRRR